MFGMDVAHSCASGMNGLRAAGDLVARLQMAKGMRITQAKRYVADRLGVTPLDLSDNTAMHELRGELRLGRVFETESSYYADPSPLEAKWHVAELLELPINSVERFRAGLSCAGPAAPATAKDRP
jgi:dimethylamine--corrinoid protein Co-methyltransferase